jgi:hypothetical protein
VIGFLPPHFLIPALPSAATKRAVACDACEQHFDAIWGWRAGDWRRPQAHIDGEVYAANEAFLEAALLGALFYYLAHYRLSVPKSI